MKRKESVDPGLMTNLVILATFKVSPHAALRKLSRKWTRPLYLVMRAHIVGARITSVPVPLQFFRYTIYIEWYCLSIFSRICFEFCGTLGLRFSEREILPIFF